MITQHPHHWQGTPWQETLRQAYRDPGQLLAHLDIDPAALSEDFDPGQPFAMRVPGPFVARMRRGDPHDPLLRQVLPLAVESVAVTGYVDDPLQEAQQNPKPGLIHKYRNRALLITTGACAINCRYCFRRHFDYAANNPSRSDWQHSLALIAADPDITEVILSGGDPLLADDKYLSDLITALEAIPSLQRLRIHTRIPIVLPSRVTDDLCQRLQRSRLRSTVVLHSNHPNEIDQEVAAATARLAAAGVLLLNQSVLLRGVNDSAAILDNLAEALFAAGVLPYYLFLLDPVAGAAHFDLPLEEARELYRELLALNSGYMVPRLVREVPGKPAKQPVNL